MSSDNRQLDGRDDGSSKRVDAFSVEAASLERQAALAVVAGEVSHELAHTLSFLRVLVEDVGEGTLFSSEDAALARREVERLARLMGHLRWLKLSPVAPAAVPLREVVKRAVAVVRAAVVETHICLASSLDTSLTLATDPALLYLLVRDMLVDVAWRSSQPGRIDLRVVLPDGQQDGSLEVWGSGRCGPVPPDVDMFAPWITETRDRTSLGLSVANRIARMFGWMLEAIGDGPRDGLRVRIPASSFCSESR